MDSEGGFQVGNELKGVLFRVERVACKGKRLVFLGIRCHSPHILQVMANDEEMCSILKKMKKGTLIHVWGKVIEEGLIDPSRVEVYRRVERVEEQQHPFLKFPAPEGIGEQVMGSRDLLSLVLQQLSTVDLGYSIIFVCKTWSAAALRVLERRSTRVVITNVADCLLEAYSKARNLDESWTTTVSAHASTAYTFCEMSARRGGLSLLRCHVEPQDIRSQTLGRPTAVLRYEMGYLRFMQASFFQLSILAQARDTTRLKTIGYALHNCPSRSSGSKNAPKWALELRIAGILCQELDEALSAYYGVDYWWPE